jgi:hypothetical protein
VAGLFAAGPLNGDDAALNISFVVRAFQPAGETFGDDHLFAGPCLRPADFTGSWTPPPGGPPLLLVSLGTSVNRRPDFFRRCAESFADTPWHVVMTLGGGVDPASLCPLPPNVEAHPWVPHLTVLEHATAFVCQSGHGSLMEAFHQGVPVVVVPHQLDQRATARQVADLGLGRLIAPEDLDGHALRAAVDEVAADQGTTGWKPSWTPVRPAGRRPDSGVDGGRTAAGDAPRPPSARAACAGGRTRPGQRDRSHNPRYLLGEFSGMRSIGSPSPKGGSDRSSFAWLRLGPDIRSKLEKAPLSRAGSLV